MKKQFYTLGILMSMLFAFNSCNNDNNDSPKKDCFTCNFLGTKTEYCYENGSDSYTATVAGETTTIPLQGQTWTDAKSQLNTLCSLF